VLTAEPLIAWGIFLAVVSGVMNGMFSLPMRFLGEWSWENVWTIFTVVACVLMPIGLAVGTVSNLPEALAQAPAKAIVIALAAGFAWGFGAIMFGQGVSAIGIAMTNTLVLAISASLGSFLPMLLLAPEQLRQPQGKAIMLGTGIATLGIALCGYAGRQRERSQRTQETAVRGKMVGYARPFWVGVLLCVGGGLLSAVFNIGYSLAHAVSDSAISLGNSAFAGSNLIWLLMLTGGSVANLGFCAYLFKKNHTWSKYREAGSLKRYGLSILMALLWGGAIFLYGSAAPKLGQLGPAIGWPLMLSVGLLTANVCGFLAGEWKFSRVPERVWMGAGLLILLAAIITLGWSSTLA
jgi:L-rhamnose-H+ transport protein